MYTLSHLWRFTEKKSVSVAPITLYGVTMEWTLCLLESPSGILVGSNLSPLLKPENNEESDSIPLKLLCPVTERLPSHFGFP